MRAKSHFETSTTSAAQHLWQLTVLISDLKRTVRNFEANIEVEENRAQIFNMEKPGYPVLTRNFKARRDNLLVTISMLENQLKRAEASARR